MKTKERNEVKMIEVQGMVRLREKGDLNFWKESNYSSLIISNNH